MESQDKDKEKEYEHNVWEIYRKEWATASPERKTELNKRMRRWQELMKNGWTAQQAYYKAMEEELDYRVAKEPSDKSPGYSFWAKMRKAPFVVLGLALVVAIVYSVVITRDMNALNTKLESVQSDLTSTQAELDPIKQTLASTQAELSSLNNILVSIQDELEAAEAKVMLFQETFGADVFSNEQPEIAGVGSVGSPNITNIPSADNPTWQELIAFLLDDPTDDETFSEYTFNCVSFAEMLHNNAERKGIKAAFVAVSFEGEEVGHALNAFRTTDKGLVYVDCTGITDIQALSIRLTELRYGYTIELDNIAYVVKGEEYGRVSIDRATSPEYSYYEQTDKSLSDWEPGGIVESIEIYW